MPLFFSKCKRFYKDFIALLLCLGCGAVLFCFSVENFPLMDGKHTYYLYSSSSQAEQKTRLSVQDWTFIKGESVQFSFENEKKANEILKMYNAKIVKMERVGDIVSYYAYTPQFSHGVMVEGKKVNLHIALNMETRMGGVGSPILFGGY